MKDTRCTATRTTTLRRKHALLAGFAAGILAITPLLAHLASRAFRAEHRARRDPLTGIANRVTTQQVYRSLVTSGRPPTVLFLDLDHFKKINDQHGHLTGDALIREVATRLQHWARSHDGFAGRLGGDEFVLLISQTSTAEALEAAHQARSAIAAPITVTDHHRRTQLKPSATVGVAMAGCAPDWSAMLKAADIALYRAKDAHRECAVYQPGMTIPDPGGRSDDEGNASRDHHGRSTGILMESHECLLDRFVVCQSSQPPDRWRDPTQTAEHDGTPADSDHGGTISQAHTRRTAHV
ncbi:GGDEF domain-containing protein [Catellatospora citrea]|uniref:GGDEF domain-containing protein n=1 Tax=Catellatospora citrea TaxID=53366 RepID=UPI0033F602F0